jgi:hypothetical protein
MSTRALCATLSFLLVAACAATSGAPEANAVLSQASAAARSEIETTVSKALHRDRVQLADDAFVSTASIIIEPVVIRDANGQRLQGRETRRPDHFTLLTRADKCFLRHDETGEEWPLNSVSCKAIR